MKHKQLTAPLTGFAALLALTGLAQATLPMTVGNLVVVRVGDGTAALTNSSTAVFLEEFTTAGAPVNTVPMPIAAAGANFPHTNSGNSTSEAFLTTSGTGTSTYLILAGYGTVPGSIGSVVTTTSAVVPRVISRVDLNGNIDSSTAIGDAFSAGNIRSACSDNGTQFWATGSNSGIRYVAALGATTTTQITASPTNNRVTDISGGQLYGTSASGSTQGLMAIGTPPPPTTASTATILNGFPTATGPSNYDFYFADAQTVYVADDRTNGSGGIQKWTEAAGLWTLQYTLAPSTTLGCRGLTGTNVGGTVTLYATTGTPSTTANALVSVVDTGVGSTFTTLATAVTNTWFHGVRIIPGNASTPSTAFCSGDAVGTTCVACGNNGAAGRGCGNSVFSTGAELTTSGVASLANDTLVLTASDIPGPGLFFQANGLAASPVTFGDGMLCASVGIIRMGVVFPTPTFTASYPGGLTPNPISIAGAPINPGDVKHYQCWYRDAAVFCTTATFNTSNGRTLSWAP